MEINYINLACIQQPRLLFHLFHLCVYQQLQTCAYGDMTVAMKCKYVYEVYYVYFMAFLFVIQSGWLVST